MKSYLTVRHSTVYRYKEPVALGEHRMMFRPRESHDLRLIQSELAIDPQPVHLRWLHDPIDNSVAVATFEGTTSELRFESTATLEHFETSVPEYPLEEYARTYPFRYSDEDFANLVRPLAHHYRPQLGWHRPGFDAAGHSCRVESSGRDQPQVS
jgi:transglutaminase-like putative cysteine protease